MAVSLRRMRIFDNHKYKKKSDGEKETMRRNYTKILFAMIITLFAGLSAGAVITYRYMTYIQQQKISTDRIAVVNLDEGVTTADGTQYYAADLVSYPGDNFVQTSLEEARVGLADNIFAGYIVI